MRPARAAMRCQVAAHPIVRRVVFHLGQPKRLEHRRDVASEPTAQPLLDAVPTLHRVLRRSPPCLDGAVLGRLLFIRIAERHPVVVLAQHRVEIVDAAQVIAELGGADLHYQCRRVSSFVAATPRTRTSRAASSTSTGLRSFPSPLRQQASSECDMRYMTSTVMLTYGWVRARRSLDHAAAAAPDPWTPHCPGARFGARGVGAHRVPRHRGVERRRRPGLHGARLPRRIRVARPGADAGQLAGYPAVPSRQRATVRVSPHGRRLAAVLGRPAGLRVRRGAGDWVEASIRIDSIDQAVLELLALGTDIEVLRPPALRRWCRTPQGAHCRHVRRLSRLTPSCDTRMTQRVPGCVAALCPAAASARTTRGVA